MAKNNSKFFGGTVIPFFPPLFSLGRVIERGVVFCAIAACLFSCTPFGGLITTIDVPQQADVIEIVETNEGIVWLGEALGHSDAEFLWGPPQKDWMYRNIIDNCVYRYTGLEWVIWVNGSQAAIATNVVIDGAYIPLPGAYYPVRMVFTDGSAADGYISSGATATGTIEDADIGRVILYGDYWNDGAAGKIFHTLMVLDTSGSGANERILLGRAFDMSDAVVLELDAARKLQPRAAVANPNDLGGGDYIPIYTVEELRWIDDSLTSRKKNYLQMADLDLLGDPPANRGNPTLEKHNWEPLGEATTANKFTKAFKGIFDGNGYEIRNLYVNTTDKLGAGLFMCVDGGTLRNITIASGSVTAAYNAGGIVGRAKDATITGCVNNAAITTYTEALTGPAGGIAGTTTGGSITNCGNTGSITAGDKGPRTGGIAGSLKGTIVSTCFNRGNVTGQGDTGGIAGSIAGGEIRVCYNTGKIAPPPASSALNYGGLAGTTEGTVSITASYNTGLVNDSGQNTSGWLIGKVEGNTTTMSYCYYLYQNQGSRPLSDRTVAIGTLDGNTGNALFSDQTGGWPSGGLGGVWNATDWKDGSLDGGWVSGGTQDGINSAFPKLRWEP